MQDRMTEFLAGVKQSADTTPRKVMFNTPADIELGFIKKKVPAPAPATLANDMDTFSRETESIRSSLSALRANIDQVQALYIKTISSTTNEKADKTSTELDILLNSTNSIAKGVKRQLDMIGQETTALQAAETPLPPADLKIRLNQHTTLTTKLQELIREYQELQGNYKLKYEEKIARQYKIARPEATDDEIKLAIQENDPSKVFVQEIAGQPQAMLDATVYIRERQKDIVRLESSIRELHQLFLDMSILVDNQGELLNHIEFNVDASSVYIESAAHELERAIAKKRRHRKMMIALTIFLMILTAIIVVPIVVSMN